MAKFSDLLTIKTYGRDVFIRGTPEDEDIQLAQEAMIEIAESVASQQYRLVVLDEANVAVRYGLIKVQQILDLLDQSPKGIEFIITGRHADPRLVARADLVTEMQEVKHYYQQGVKARVGVEK